MDPQARPFVPQSNVPSTAVNSGNMSTGRSRSPLRRSVPVKGPLKSSASSSSNVNVSPSSSVTLGGKELDFEIKSFEEIMREKRKKLDKDSQSPSFNERRNPAESKQSLSTTNNTNVKHMTANTDVSNAETSVAVNKTNDDFDDIDKTIAELDELMNS